MSLSFARPRAETSETGRAMTNGVYIVEAMLVLVMENSDLKPVEITYMLYVNIILFESQRTNLHGWFDQTSSC